MKKEVKIIIIVIAIALAVVIGYFIGYKRAYDKMEVTNQTESQETFYAEIKEIKNNLFSVQGLSVNDINFRGEFEFSVVEETKLVWRGEDIKLTDLDVGDKIAITFDGEILESYPAQIKDIVKIQLLDDEI